MPQCAASVSSRRLLGAELEAGGSARPCTSRCRRVAPPRPVRPRRPGTSSRSRRCGRRACGPSAGRSGRRRRRRSTAGPASISAVRPCTWVGPGSTPGLSRRGEAVLDVAVVAEGQGGDADDAGLPGAEAGRLDVDDGPARAGFGCRPAPGLAHVSRMARCGDKSPVTAGSLGSVSAPKMPGMVTDSWTCRAGGRGRRALGVAGDRPRRWRDDRRPGRDDAGQVDPAPARRGPSHGRRHRHQRQVDHHPDDRGGAGHAGAASPPTPRAPTWTPVWWPRWRAPATPSWRRSRSTRCTCRTSPTPSTRR